MTHSVEETVRVSSALFTSINELTMWAQGDESGMLIHLHLNCTRMVYHLNMLFKNIAVKNV